MTTLHYILFARDDKPPATYDHTHQGVNDIITTRTYPPATYDHGPHSIHEVHPHTTHAVPPSILATLPTPHAVHPTKNGTLPRKNCAGESTNTYITWNYSRTRTM